MNRLSVSAAFNSIDRGMWIYRWKPIIVPITGGNYRNICLCLIKSRICLKTDILTLEVEDEKL